MGVFLDGWKTGAIRNLKSEAFERDGEFRLQIFFGYYAIFALQALSELRESRLEFSAKNGCDAERSQIVRIHRRV